MSFFGSNNTGGGLFGQAKPPALNLTTTNTATQPQSGGLFGSNTQSSTTGGLFGGQTQQQQQPSGGLFGQQPQQQQGGLFGGQQQQNTGTGGGLFGQSTTQSSGGGLFGGAGQAQNTTTGGGLFGQSTQQPSGGLFGGQQQQQPQQQTGGLFGNTQSQQPQQQTGGLFGNTQTQQPQQNQGGLFGGGFSMNQPQQQQQQQQQGAFGGFGGSTLGVTNINQQQVSQQGTNAVVEKIQRVKNQWDPTHPDYAFQYYFFNYIGKERASQFQKPLQDDLTAWEKAWSERPTDGCVPVRANGFKDLDLRVKSQEQQVNSFRVALHDIQSKLEAIQNRHDLTTSTKLEDCRRRHIALSRRALSLAARVQVLKNRGYALQPEEEELKKRLDGLARLINDPANSGRMNEIWARMQVVTERARVMEESLSKVEIVWDDKQLQVAAKLLSSNAAGLEYLHKEVHDIEKTFASWEENQKSRMPAF